MPANTQRKGLSSNANLLATSTKKSAQRDFGPSQGRRASFSFGHRRPIVFREGIVFRRLEAKHVLVISAALHVSR